MSATILCYHKVGLGQDEGRRLNIEPERLRSHVRFFSRKKLTFLVAGDLKGSWNSGTICLTFDDAFSSTMSNAPMILEELGVRGSFYAVPGCVGGTSAWEGDLARPLADWQILRDVEARGHEIGNHSMNHPRFADLAPNDQLGEIVFAHKRFIYEGIHPKSFCFPYGSLSRQSAEQVQMAGYKVGLALGKRPARPEDNRLSLPRIVVAYSDSIPMLLYKLHVKPLFKRDRPIGG